MRVSAPWTGRTVLTLINTSGKGNTYFQMTLVERLQRDNEYYRLEICSLYVHSFNCLSLPTGQ